MPIAVATVPPTAHVMSVDNRWNDWKSNIHWTSEQLYLDATRQFVTRFQVGDIMYRPLEALQATFEPPSQGGDGRFVVAELQKLCAGRGKTLDLARADWEAQIDWTIQQLLATEDFERTPEQVEQWNLLSRWFDMGEIRYSRPVRNRCYGTLMSVYPRPWKVRWIDGTTSRMSREQMPAEMIGFRPGQPFDAVVERDPRDWTMLRIVSAFATKLLPQVLEDEANELLSSVPSTSDLPDAAWD